MIQANIVLDSTMYGRRITTFELVYPLIIHNQLLTHRMFSRSSQSSRAVPIKRMVEQTLACPAIPERLYAKKRGMSPGLALSDDRNNEALRLIRSHCDAAIELAQKLDELGVHKQWANRYLSPFSHIRTVLTATELDNFFIQRISEDAQSEMNKLAYGMKVALSQSTPEVRTRHIPYILDTEVNVDLVEKVKVSVARCARVSYDSFFTGITSTFEDDVRLYDFLVSEMHMSPLEHVAFTSGDDEMYDNFRGWISYRAIYKEFQEFVPYE